MKEESPKIEESNPPEPKPEPKPIPYRVVARSTEDGVDHYDYPSRSDSLEGLTTVVLTDLYKNDDVIRWYRVVRITEEEYGNS